MSVIINAASPGISNKIKSYLSLLRKYEVVKTTKHSDSYMFSNIPHVEDGDMEKYPVIDNQGYMAADMWRLKVYDEDIEYSEDYKTIDLLYEKTPPYFMEKYLKLLSSLEINPSILEYVDEFTKGWKDMVGVHIRSWYCDKRRFHSNDIFEEEIDKLDPDQKFFFCCDNADVQNHFVGKYGDRVVTYEREMHSNPQRAESGHHDDIQLTTDAFVELLILSKCSKIIGTYLSTFDELAWWYSGCKSEVIIPRPNNFDEQYHESQFLKK